MDHLHLKNEIESLQAQISYYKNRYEEEIRLKKLYSQRLKDHTSGSTLATPFTTSLENGSRKETQLFQEQMKPSTKRDVFFLSSHRNQSHSEQEGRPPVRALDDSVLLTRCRRGAFHKTAEDENKEATQPPLQRKRSLTSPELPKQSSTPFLSGLFSHMWQEEGRKQEKKEFLFTVKSIQSFKADDRGALRFNKGIYIKVVSVNEEEGIYHGYKGKKKGWFPASYVKKDLS